MGVVYKALQCSLKRVVALKIIRAGGSAGPDELARFHTEAEAIAQLQHPHIVQIYETGERDGLPYFSLEFVGGGNLKDYLAGVPLPPRDAAMLAETLARAVFAAHERGIIHRDLKPANILLAGDALVRPTPDGARLPAAALIPKITDFGLAKRLDTDSGQTQAGQVMGTPSYMAPEQAAGLADQMGPRVDVYALGAILYEMLTGRPPFRGATVQETLEQVRSQEPVSPRLLNDRIPRDLETVCLKALAKEPGRRYQTAQEMAEDLRRYLQGEPIQARPVGAWERAWRWCQRNSRLAAMTATIFVLLVAAVVISAAAAVTIAAERNQKEQERQAAEEARDVANEQVALALDTVKTLIIKVQNQLENTPRTQPLKKALLQTAAEGLEQIRERAQGTNSTEVAIAFASVHMRMGGVYRQLGETEKAFQHVQESHRINLERAQAQPDSDRAQSNLAASYTVLAEMSLEMRRDLATTLDFYQRALRLRQQLHDHPHDRVDLQSRKRAREALAETAVRVGATLFRMGDPAQAREYFRQSLVLREDLAQNDPQDFEGLQNLSRSYHAMGETCFALHENELGRQYFGKCLKIRERISQGNPENPRLKLELAQWCGVLGDKAVLAQDLPDARQQYQRSVTLYRELVELDPKNVDYQRRLGTAYYEIATACHLANDEVAADEHFRACRRIRQSLADADPQNARRQMELMGVLPHCGEHTKAAELAAQLLQSNPKDQEIHFAVGCCYSSCAPLPKDPALRQEYIQKALEALQQAVALGFKNVFVLETDPDLAPVRDEPGFRKILEQLQRP
jgi:tetratricopeptide (TPR) repeat protein